MTTKTNARRKARKSNAARTAVKKTTTPRKRVVFDDNAKIKVIGEHTRRDNSRYGKQYETMRRTKTVGAFWKAKGQREVLRAAIADKFVKVG